VKYNLFIGMFDSKPGEVGHDSHPTFSGSSWR